MFTVDFRFEENQTTIEFPCNEKFLSAKFDELGVEDKLKTSQYMIGTNYAALKRLVTDFVNNSQVSRHKKAQFFRGSGYFVCSQYKASASLGVSILSVPCGLFVL